MDAHVQEAPEQQSKAENRDREEKEHSRPVGVGFVPDYMSQSPVSKGTNVP